jgi:hypothetical protein
MKQLKMIITAGLVAISLLSFSQKGGRKIYNWSLGVRYEFQGGTSSYPTMPASLLGPTFKYIITTQTAVEVMYLSDFANGNDIYGMFHFFNPLPEIPQNYRYYLGFGGHAGRWKFDKINPKFLSGVDGQLGMEFIGRKMPLAISVDWHPGYNFSTYSATDPKLLLLRIGITVKYTHK